jgi:putative chitinase
MKIATLAKALGILVARAEKWAPYLEEAMQAYGITTINEQASFLAQIAHESARLTRLEENLNYSAQGLANTWARFSVTGKRGGAPTIKAQSLARKPRAIANFVYANRMGNGSELSGDGWKFRGRGPIQLTGRKMYLKCGTSIGVNLLSNPDLLLQPQYGIKAAGWFWKEHGLDRFDDDYDVTRETRIINGGEHGLKERQALFNQALKALQED